MNRYDRYDRSEAVLPATECLFDKKRITPREIKADGSFSTCTLLVMSQIRGKWGKSGYTETVKHKFVSTGGTLTDEEMERELDRPHRVQHHDQTMASMGAWQVVGLIRLSDMKVVGQDHTLGNYPLHVYK